MFDFEKFTKDLKERAEKKDKERQVLESQEENCDTRTKVAKFLEHPLQRIVRNTPAE
jgi:chaperonin cofactor prefoldin